RCVRKQVRRVSAAIGTDELRVNSEPLQISRSRSTDQAGQLRIEQGLNLIQSNPRSEPDAVPGRIVVRAVGAYAVDRFETTRQLDGLPGIEHKARPQRPAADHAVKCAVIDRQPLSTPDRQIIGPKRLNDVANIELRNATGGAWIP